MSAAEIAERLRASLPGELADALAAFSRAMDDRAPMLELLRSGLAHLVGSIGSTNHRELSGADAERADATLGEWRAWARAFQIDILPTAWRFRDRESVAPGEVEAQAVYRPDAERGKVFRVRSFGFAVAGGVRELAKVSVSAGYAPAGLAELESLLQPGDGPIQVQLRERLRAFRDASLGGTLEPVAVQLFVNLIDQYASMWEPAKAEAFASHLLALLHEEFGLVPFYPASFHDRPAGWVRIPEGVWMQSGRVTRVLRPGLEDREGRLRVPARVEVE